MKKVKLMLLSLSILAVVGGALAFTAKEGTTYCTALPDGNGNCPTDCPATGQLTAPNSSQDFVCTAQTITGGFDPCHTSQSLTVDCAFKVNKTIE